MKIRRVKKTFKVIAFDTLAIICFIGVILFGWLPGPGGIPLFILGMSLLAVNHEWAETWLNKFKIHGMSIKRWLFPRVEWVQQSYDSLVIIAMTMAGVIIFRFENRLIEAGAVAIIIFSLFIFMINRERFDKLRKHNKKLRKYFSKH